MHKDKIKIFRQTLSEMGMELTLEQASKFYYQAKSFIVKSKKISQFELWKMQEEEFEGISEEDKQNYIKLYQAVKEF